MKIYTSEWESETTKPKLDNSWWIGWWFFLVETSMFDLSDFHGCQEKQIWQWTRKKKIKVGMSREIVKRWSEKNCYVSTFNKYFDKGDHQGGQPTMMSCLTMMKKSRRYENWWACEVRWWTSSFVKISNFTSTRRLVLLRLITMSLQTNCCE